MAGSIYQLPTISADTNAGTGAMAGASQSFSHAGTVFGELRKSILDEEQRAIENAYREKVFNENVRQFDERMDLDWDKFGFDQDKFSKEHALAIKSFEETARHNQASENADMARIALNRDQFNWQRDRETGYAKALGDFLGMDKRDAEKVEAREALKREQIGSNMDAYQQLEQRMLDINNTINSGQINDAGTLQYYLNQLDSLGNERKIHQKVIADWEKANPLQLENKYGTSAFDRSRGLRAYMAAAGYAVNDKDDFFRPLYERDQASKAAIAAKQAEHNYQMELERMKKGLDLKEKAKNRGEVYREMRLNPNWDVHADSVLDAIEARAHQLGLNLNNKQLGDIYRRAFNLREEFFGNEVSPKGYTSIVNARPLFENFSGGASDLAKGTSAEARIAEQMLQERKRALRK